MTNRESVRNLIAHNIKNIFNPKKYDTITIHQNITLFGEGVIGESGDNLLMECI